MTGHVTLFLLCLTIICPRGVQSDGNSPTVPEARGGLATIRKHPTFLPKCTASLITPVAFLTTAACILCSRRCTLLVQVVFDKMDDPDAVAYNATKVAYHPRYKGSASEYNIGLVIVSEPVRDVRILELPSDYNYQIAGTPSSVYFWEFQPKDKNYRLVMKNLKTITNEVCSGYVHAVVSNRYICAKGNQTLSPGRLDFGTPLIRRQDRKSTILGIFTGVGADPGSEILLYQSIFPSIGWIRKKTRELS